MVQQEQFYKKIFSWKYLIINGYFDFQNKSVYGIEKASNFYGKDDVIDPESFNLNILNDETIYDLVKSEEYITYKSPYEDGKVITEIKGDNYRSDKKAVRTNASSTTPIVFTIPKSDNVVPCQ